MKLSRLKIILLTLLLASIALWITNQQSSQVAEPKIQQTLQPAYSWQATDTKIWQVKRSEQNQQTIIEAESILYQEQTQSSQFTKPQVQLIDGEQITQLNSQTGRSVNEQVITFEKDVIIKQTEPGQVSPTTLLSEHLEYNTVTNRLSTDQKVSITQYNGQTTGVGLSADLGTSEFTLYSNVKGQYDPNKMNNTPLQGQ